MAVCIWRVADSGVHLAQAVEFAAHNYSLFLLGVMILWFGWYGFNPGSATAILPAGTSLPVQLAAVNTTLAPCASGFTGLFFKAILTKIRTGAFAHEKEWSTCCASN